MELPRVLTGLGYDYLMMDESATPHGAVTTAREGEIYADFLNENRGKYQGVILSLPNFGDETGAVAALYKADVPLLIHVLRRTSIRWPPQYEDRLLRSLRQDVFYLTAAESTALSRNTESRQQTLQAKLDYFAACAVVSACGDDGRRHRARTRRSRPSASTRWPSNATALPWRPSISVTSSSG